MMLQRYTTACNKLVAAKSFSPTSELLRDRKYRNETLMSERGNVYDGLSTDEKLRFIDESIMPKFKARRQGTELLLERTITLIKECTGRCLSARDIQEKCFYLTKCFRISQRMCAELKFLQTGDMGQSLQSEYLRDYEAKYLMHNRPNEKKHEGDGTLYKGKTTLLSEDGMLLALEKLKSLKPKLERRVDKILDELADVSGVMIHDNFKKLFSALEDFTRSTCNMQFKRDKFENSFYTLKVKVGDIEKDFIVWNPSTTPMFTAAEIIDPPMDEYEGALASRGANRVLDEDNGEAYTTNSFEDSEQSINAIKRDYGYGVSTDIAKVNSKKIDSSRPPGLQKDVCVSMEGVETTTTPAALIRVCIKYCEASEALKHRLKHLSIEVLNNIDIPDTLGELLSLVHMYLWRHEPHIVGIPSSVSVNGKLKDLQDLFKVDEEYEISCRSSNYRFLKLTHELRELSPDIDKPLPAILLSVLDNTFNADHGGHYKFNIPASGFELRDHPLLLEKLLIILWNRMNISVEVSTKHNLNGMLLGILLAYCKVLRLICCQLLPQDFLFAADSLAASSSKSPIVLFDISKNSPIGLDTGKCSSFSKFIITIVGGCPNLETVDLSDIGGSHLSEIVSNYSAILSCLSEGIETRNKNSLLPIKSVRIEGLIDPIFHEFVKQFISTVSPDIIPVLDISGKSSFLSLARIHQIISNKENVTNKLF